jgi:hypothetical protein
MEYPTLALSELKPRDTDQLRKKLPLHKGLAAYYFFGVFALFAPFPPIIFFAVSGNIGQLGWGPIVLFLLVCEAISLFLLFKANKSYQRRLGSLSQGNFVKGIVKNHGRNFVFWKSSQNYNITIAFDFAGERKYHRVQSNKTALHDNFPIGTTLWGLHDNDGLGSCFPIEFGILLEAPPEIQKPLERKRK